MTTRVHYDQVTEHENGLFVTDASTLGFRPGEPWPKMIETDMGNGRSFVHVKDATDDGDLVSSTYEQANGSIRLLIFND